MHLWWHPHNFGLHLEQNLAALSRVLDAFADLQRREGMQTLTLAEAAAQAGHTG